MFGAQRESKIERGEVERNQVRQRVGLDAIKRASLRHAGAERPGLRDAGVDAVEPGGAVPLTRHKAALSTEVDAQALPHQRGLRTGRLHACRWRRSGRYGASGIGKRCRCRRAAFGKSVAIKLAPHKADDLLAAPDMVAQEFGRGLQCAAVSVHGIAQIQPALAQWRIWQHRAPSQLERTTGPERAKSRGVAGRDGQLSRPRRIKPDLLLRRGSVLEVVSHGSVRSGRL